MSNYTVQERAAAVMQARLSWPQADDLAQDLATGGLLRPDNDPIRALHAEFAEAHAGGASSNDIAQLLDDWLVAQGLPPVLYAR